MHAIRDDDIHDLREKVKYMLLGRSTTYYKGEGQMYAIRMKVNHMI